jgi:acetate kinase
MRILVVNAGSSSLKLRLLGDDDVIVASADPRPEADLGTTLRDWPRPDVIGHRIVHGGTEFSTAVRIDDDVTRRLRALTDLAPLHQPKSLAALAAVTAVLPDVQSVACFDTAFHRTMPEAACTYAVPARWRERYGVRRYGFHGLSHAYAARRAVQLAGAGGRVVTCHLGAGASLCAVRDGRSVDTTMGFTPLEGLVMATRSGSVDPGLVLWLAEHERLAPREIATALEKDSGMLALAGTADMREVTRRAEDGDPAARLALDVYLHRLAGSIGAMAAALRGLDVLAFTGGVGENSAPVRAGAAQRLAWLGVAVDETRNAAVHGDAVITAADARVACVVVAAREDLEIAYEVRQLLG